MVDKELIEIWRNMLKPSVSLWLLNTNYEEMGEQDKEEFERDFDEILDLALIGLKHKAQLPQERTDKHTESHACDLISRQAAIDALDCISGVEEVLRSLPPAQPEAKEDWLYDYLVGRLGKSIVDNKEEFHKWFERMVWHVKRCDALSEERRSRQWIPCSERLPEGAEPVLVSFCEDAKVFRRVQMFPPKIVKKEYERGNAEAWMPLLEPYKPKERKDGENHE